MEWPIDFRRVAIFVSIAFLSACTKGTEPGSLTLVLPDTGSGQSASKVQSSPSSGEWSSEVPGSINEIDCYAVFIGGPDAKLSTSTCKNAEGNSLMTFGPHVGFVPSNGSITFPEIPSGSGRVIYVVGVKRVGTLACENNMPGTHEFTEANYTSPYLVGKFTTAIEPGVTNYAKVAIQGNFTNAYKVDDCDFYGDDKRAPSPTPSPTPVPYLQAVKIAAGAKHACAVVNGGVVKCWGYGGSGALGYESTNSIGDAPGEMGNALLPVNLGPGFVAAEVTAGSEFTCARSTAGLVKCWGKNNHGQLGQGDQTTRGAATGTMGNLLNSVNLGTGRTAIKITAGGTHVCALMDNGAVKCWGDGASQSQLGLGDNTLRGDGPGEMGNNLPELSLGLTAVDIEAGLWHTCAILTNGSMKCWGNGFYGQLGTGSTSNSNVPTLSAGGANFAKVSAGLHHTCAVESSGVMKCWGKGTNGRLGNSATTQQNSPVLVSGGTSWLSVAAGGGHTCGISTLMEIFCWGLGDTGQIGSESFSAASAPQPVLLAPASGGLEIVTSLDDSTGTGFTCARFSDGRVKCWGSGSYGQLGNGATSTVGGTAGEMSALSYIDLGSPSPP